MKLYFALSHSISGDFKILERNKKLNNILSSYFVLQKMKLETLEKWFGNKEDYSFFLDSGAFSSLRQGTNIDLDSYISFIKDTKDIWEVYASLDVIGDYKKTRKNLEYMESKGLKPVPTFHYGSPLKELQTLCTNYNYIALGGLVPLALHKKELESWLDICWAIIYQETIKKGKSITKVHGFGANSFWAWKKYPWYSVDATSWSAPVNFGRFSPIKNNFRVSKSNYDKTIYNNKLKKYYSIKKSAEKTEFNKHVNLKQAEEYYEAALFITRLWESRGISFK